MLQNDVLLSQGLFQHYFEDHPDGLLVVDPDGRIQQVNAALLSMLGFVREETLQMPLDRYIEPAGAVPFADGRMTASKLECSARHSQGHELEIRLSCVPLRSGDRQAGWLITLEKLERPQNIVSVFSADGVFTYISPSVTALLGYLPEEVIGKPAAAFNHPDEIRRLVEFRGLSYIHRESVRFIGRVRHKNGEYRLYETTSDYVRDEAGEIVQTICVGRDITGIKPAE
ncbi:PAS domain-containing protein [Cohnella rhizosphaerae]|uniref:PAS domain-containing protein n=1 Tax=Cohnella rhizosphaerae TaxID=1457232 RepID=A0A9X4QVP6_9BACL|nr:PAS domain-containing protein [Cohnella rhizosphaerae]MDG0812683.1 PAS domain-containing protein [Cohnella rhizosphaerae]